MELSYDSNDTVRPPSVTEALRLRYGEQLKKMLFKHSLSTQLQERREEFLSFDRILREDLSSGAEHLSRIAAQGSAEIKLRAGVAGAPGAVPSRELDEARSTVIPFKTAWRSHEEARRWALDILFDRVTGAAGGVPREPVFARTRNHAPGRRRPGRLLREPAYQGWEIY